MTGITPADMQRSTPILSLLSGDALSRPAEARVPSLAAQPFRPGEMPTPVVIRLSSEAFHVAIEAADAASLPVALWVRIAVECARHLEELNELGGSIPALHGALDELAYSAPAHQVGSLRTHRQRIYAQALRRGEPSSRRAISESRLTLLLPDTSLAAWSQCAAIAGLDLDRWCDRLVHAAPERAHTWEAAAAEAGRSLGEWVYAMALMIFRRP